MNGTVSNRTFRLAVALALCLLGVECGEKSPANPTPVGPPQGSPSPMPSPEPGPVPLPPLAGGAEIFVGAGDIATCDPNSEGTARLLDGIGGTVFTLGDQAYPRGAEQEYRDCYDPTWGRHRGRTRPTPGNHEYESRNAGPYFDYFGAAAGPYGLGYYSYELGSWLILSLNSNVNIPAQQTWMKELLGRSRNRCTLAYWHHPLFSSGSSAKIPAIRSWWNVLHAANADVILSAHDHLYERFAPQDDGGTPDPARGLRQFVVGTGGAVLHPPVNVAANSEVRIAAYGVLKLTLLPDSYEWEFIPVSGQGDRGMARCH
jgi:hypothetical protein